MPYPGNAFPLQGALVRQTSTAITISQVGPLPDHTAGLCSTPVQEYKERLDNRFQRGSVGRYQKIIKLNFHPHHTEMEDFGVISRLCSILGFSPHGRGRFALGAHFLLAHEGNYSAYTLCFLSLAAPGT